MCSGTLYKQTYISNQNKKSNIILESPKQLKSEEEGFSKIIWKHISKNDISKRFKKHLMMTYWDQGGSGSPSRTREVKRDQGVGSGEGQGPDLYFT